MATFDSSLVTVLPGYGIAMGLVGSATSSFGRTSGYVSTSATTNKPVLATTYTPQGTNAQRSINSTSATDSAASTGVQTVTITYLDTSFALHSETVSMNGTTGVNTVGTNIAYIENIMVATSGSSGQVGTIQVWTGTGATGSVWGSISIGDNQTFWAHHYVPANTTCYVLGMVSAASVVAGKTTLVHTGNPSNNLLPTLQVGTGFVHQAIASFNFTFQVPMVFPGPDRIYMIEAPEASTASTAYAGFEWIHV